MSVRFFWVMCVMVAIGCGPEQEHDASQATWLEKRDAPLPVWLSELGMIDALSSASHSAEKIAYTPKYELLSPGVAKERFLSIPDGRQIGQASDGQWLFPVGTVAVKTFGFKDAKADAQTARIETRVIVKRDAGWEYAVYHWNREGTQAKKLEPGWAPRRFELDGENGPFVYEIPGHLDCEVCHEAHPQATLLA